MTYGTNSAVVTLWRNNVTLASVGTTPNQKAAATGVNSLGTGNPVDGAVLGLSANDAAAAFDRLSGEIHATLETSLVDDSRLTQDVARQLLVQLQKGKPGSSSAWAQAAGAFGSWVGDGNAAAASCNRGGLLLGGDLAHLEQGGGVGLFAGYSLSTIDVPLRQSISANDSYHVGSYWGARWGDLGLGLVGAYRIHNFATTRTASFPGFYNVLTGQYWAGTGQVSGEISYDLSLSSGARITPFANLGYVRLDSTIGIGAAGTFDIGLVPVELSGRIGWRYASGDVALDRTMAFARGGAAFTVAGVPVVRDTAAIDAELAFTATPAANFGLKYSGHLGAGLSSTPSTRAKRSISDASSSVDACPDGAGTGPAIAQRRILARRDLWRLSGRLPDAGC